VSFVVVLGVELVLGPVSFAVVVGLDDVDVDVTLFSGVGVEEDDDGVVSFVVVVGPDNIFVLGVDVVALLVGVGVVLLVALFWG
jgi:hypothetical protein